MNTAEYNENFTEELRTSYPLFITMAETVHEMIFVLDSDRRFVYYNNRYKQFADKHNLSYEYGLRPGEAFKCINAVMGDTFCGQTSFCQYCGASRAIANASENPHAVEDCKIVSMKGNAFDLKVSTSKMTINDTDYTLFCVVDISSEYRKQALEKIFFHDINNLAGGMSMIVDLIDGYSRQSDYKSVSEVINLLTSAMSNLNNEIKSSYMLSMAEKDELHINPKQVDMSQIIDTTASFFKETSIDKDINFVTEKDADRNIFVTDESILTRVLINMVKNAVEASDDGDTVTIGYRYGKGKLTLYVNNPKVMSEEIKASVFKRSFSTKGVGRGLGTYSMRLLTVRYLKGKVSFKSDEGQGTTFYAEIPVKL